MWTDLPFHVHSQSHQPVACAVYDILYGPPLHLYTTASCTVSVEKKNEPWQSITVFQSRLIYSMTSDFVELKEKKKEQLFLPVLPSFFCEEECVIAD